MGYVSTGRASDLVIAFETAKLRSECEDSLEAERVYGRSVAEALQRRLADLRAAVSVDDLPVGRPRITSPWNMEECMQLDLCDGKGLLFVANHVGLGSQEGSSVNWHRVNRVRIVGIADVNEK